MNDDPNPGVSCDYCGLPIPGRSIARNPVDAEPGYCCSGCRFAAGILAAEGVEGHASRLLFRLGLATFCTMNVLAFSMALWSRDVYGAHASDSTAFASALDGLFRYATLLFAAPVLFLLGGPLLANAYQAMRRSLITSDMLVLLGVSSAFAYSVISVVRGEGRIYFEVGCVVLAFMTLGKWFQASNKLKMSQSLDELAKLLPATVHLVTGNVVRDELRENVRVGHIIRVLAGERFAVDGRIELGHAEVDEQTVTGESRTILKEPGDRVFGGTLNIDGDLRVVVTAADGDETVSRLLEMVRKARRAPGHYQRLADRIAVWFVPIVGVLSFGTAVYHGLNGRVDEGILSGLAVALIACPCAFALATPMAMWTAMGRAARSHILFRNGEALEQLARITTLFIDKTGTLTSGVPKLNTVIASNAWEQDEALEKASMLAAASNHSLSLAICQATGNGSRAVANASVTTVPGKGLWMRDGQETVYLGSLRLMQESGLEIPSILTSALAAFQDDASLAFVGWGGRVRAAFVFQEQLRPEAAGAIVECRRLGMRTSVLTGDSAARAAWLEKRLATTVVAEQLPADKVAVVQAWRRNGQVVGMVGDGINDAPALASADVGVAMGCGADLSRDTASVCLLPNNLAQLPWAVSLARQTTRIIRQNLFWAFVYNIAGIVLAITGRLNPIWAGAAMVVSSAFVVANSVRLNQFPDLCENALLAEQGTCERAAPPFVSPRTESLPLTRATESTAAS